MQELHKQDAKETRYLCVRLPLDLHEAIKEMARAHERSVAAEARWLLREAHRRFEDEM